MRLSLVVQTRILCSGGNDICVRMQLPVTLFGLFHRRFCFSKYNKYELVALTNSSD